MRCHKLRPTELSWVSACLIKTARLFGISMVKSPPNNAHYTRPWPRSKGVLKTIGLSHCSHTTWSAHLYNSFFMLNTLRKGCKYSGPFKFLMVLAQKRTLKSNEMQLNFEKLHSKPKHLTEQVGNCKNRIIFRILLFHIERGESRIYKFRKNEMLTSVARPRITIPVVSLFVIFFFDYNVHRYFRRGK